MKVPDTFVFPAVNVSMVGCAVGVVQAGKGRVLCVPDNGAVIL